MYTALQGCRTERDGGCLNFKSDVMDIFFSSSRRRRSFRVAVCEMPDKVDEKREKKNICTQNDNKRCG